MELRPARVTTGHVSITSGSSRKLGKYPSELNWSSLGDVFGVYICYRNAHRPSYAMSGNQWQMRSGVKGYERRMAKEELIMIRTAPHSR